MNNCSYYKTGTILYPKAANETKNYSNIIKYYKAHGIIFFNFGILWNNLSDELKSIEDRNLFAKSIKSKLINALQ